MPSVRNAADLMVAPNRSTMEIRLAGFTWADGSPLAFRVRALSFKERAAANRAAILAGKNLPSGFDDDAWALAVVKAGLMEPALSDSQQEILQDVNAWIIDQLCDAIVRLGAIPQSAIDGELRNLAAAAGAVPPDAPDADRQ